MKSSRLHQPQRARLPASFSGHFKVAPQPQCTEIDMALFLSLGTELEGFVVV